MQSYVSRLSLSSLTSAAGGSKGINAPVARADGERSNKIGRGIVVTDGKSPDEWEKVEDEVKADTNKSISKMCLVLLTVSVTGAAAGITGVISTRRAFTEGFISGFGQCKAADATDMDHPFHPSAQKGIFDIDSLLHLAIGHKTDAPHSIPDNEHKIPYADVLEDNVSENQEEYSSSRQTSALTSQCDGYTGQKLALCKGYFAVACDDNDYEGCGMLSGPWATRGTAGWVQTICKDMYPNGASKRLGCVAYMVWLMNLPDSSGLQEDVEAMWADLASNAKNPQCFSSDHPDGSVQEQCDANPDASCCVGDDRVCYETKGIVCQGACDSSGDQYDQWSCSGAGSDTNPLYAAPGSCQGDGACADKDGAVYLNSCHGIASCFDTEHTIGASSCQGCRSCQAYDDTVSSGSCTQDCGCFGETTNRNLDWCYEKCV